MYLELTARSAKALLHGVTVTTHLAPAPYIALGTAVCYVLLHAISIQDKLRYFILLFKLVLSFRHRTALSGFLLPPF